MDCVRDIVGHRAIVWPEWLPVYDKLSQRPIEQPPPLLGRLRMTSLKSTVLDAVAEKRPTLLSLFPNAAIVRTDFWEAQKKAVDPLPAIEKDARMFTFLLVRNPSNSLAYNDIRLSAAGNNVAVIPSLPPATTRLVLLNPAWQDSRIDVLYRITGSSNDKSTSLAAKTGIEAVLLADMSMSDLYSLAGDDDRVRMLIDATRTLVPSDTTHSLVPSEDHH